MRTGRLVTAAHQLRMDQSTLSRRIFGLEKALQTRLFDRMPTSYALTISGETLVSQAEEIERLTIDIGSRLANAHSALAGPIRIATPEGFGTYFLPPLLNKLTQAHPELEIELVAAPGAVSLFKREADLAVTISPPRRDASRRGDCSTTNWASTHRNHISIPALPRPTRRLAVPILSSAISTISFRHRNTTMLERHLGAARRSYASRILSLSLRRRAPALASAF